LRNNKLCEHSLLPAPAAGSTDVLAPDPTLETKHSLEVASRAQEPQLKPERERTPLQIGNFSVVGQPGYLKAVWPDRNTLVPRNVLRINLLGWFLV
jgi:hypothetical protein